MSLELAAQHLASRGRKGDTMLVHMAPEEVSGLQALARAGGGTLTLNPDTGLPEANFLKRMLPTLIGAALTPLTGGLINPMTAGLLIGGVETARTGDLGKGLMAGLGAYGGAGLGAGLAGAGAASPAAAAQALGTPAATGAGSQAAMLAAQNAGFGQAGINALASSAGTAAGAAPVATNVLSAGANALGTEAGRSAALSAMGGAKGATKYGLAALSPMLQGSQQTPYVDGGPNYEYTYDSDAGQYTRVPVGTRDTLTQLPRMFADGGPVADMSDRNQALTLMANNGQMFATGGQVNLTGTFTAGGQGAGTPNTPQGMQQTMQPPQTPASMFDSRAIAANPQGFAQHMAQMQQREQQMPGSTMLGSGMQTDMRATAPAQPRSGGLGGMAAGFLGGGGPSYEQYAAENERRLAERRNPNNMIATHDYIGPTMSRADFEASLNRPRNSASSFAAGGGVSHLGDYSDGGRLLKGPGDGVSDSIPATIADKRPARLADGEFVVPARIVSELGNGSTDAGARKLYAMMDRIQKARGKTTGKNRVAVNSKAERLLPA